MALTRGVVASFAVGIGVGAGGCYLYISSTKTNTAARQQNESGGTLCSSAHMWLLMTWHMHGVRSTCTAVEKELLQL